MTELENLVAELPVSAATKQYLKDTAQEMVQCKDEKKGWFSRCEFQGAINLLATEGVISEAAHIGLGDAIGKLWKPLMFALIAARIEQAEKSSVRMDAILATLEKAREALDDTRGNINPERGYADELEGDVVSALESVESLISRCKLSECIHVSAGNEAIQSS